MKHRVAVMPVRVNYFDRTLQVNALKLVGYRAVCICGWRSVIQRTRPAAVDAKSGHLHG